jgi:hypothetical protein
MLKGFGKSLANLFHHERPLVGDLDESRIFLLLQYQAGFIPDSEWSQMLAHDPELLAMYSGPKTVH